MALKKARRKRRFRMILGILALLVVVAFIGGFFLSKTSFPQGAFDTDQITASWGYENATSWKEQIVAKGKSAKSVVFRCNWLGFRKAPVQEQNLVYDCRLDFHNGTVVYFSENAPYGVVEIDRETYPLQTLPFGLRRQVMGWFDKAQSSQQQQSVSGKE